MNVRLVSLLVVSTPIGLAAKNVKNDLRVGHVFQSKLIYLYQKWYEHHVQKSFVKSIPWTKLKLPVVFAVALLSSRPPRKVQIVKEFHIFSNSIQKWAGL